MPSVGSADAPRPAEDQPSVGMPFFPAVEGLRGLAVFGVLVFHGRWSIAQGGFLGVSTFFTLSGFLITSLLLRDHARTGGVGLRRFWTHRVRRLLPAALACLLLAVAYGATAGDPGQRQNLAGDVVAALGYAANWRFIASGQSYGDLFGAPSPVLHFWSLAIEEQFYVVFPLLVLLVVVVLRADRRRLAVVLGALTALSVGLSVALSGSPDRVYFGTDTRAAEILLGALLAVALAGRIDALAAGTSRLPAQGALPWLGAAALVTMLALWSVTPQSATWVHRGGLAGYAVLSALVVLAALLPTGPVARLLAVRPLRELGRISYGVYLYHWPIFLWLTKGNTSLSGVPLFAYHVGVTLGVAWLSFRYLEQPIRHGRPLLPAIPPALTLDRLAMAMVVVAAAGSLAVSATAPPRANDFDAAQQRLDQLARRPRPVGTTAAAPGGTGATGPVRPAPRLAAFGDSVMLSTALGLGDVLTARGAAEVVPGRSELGCGLGIGGQRRSAGKVEDVPEFCTGWAERWQAKIDEARPDVAVVQEGPWDVTDRLLPGDDTWRRPGDPTYDAFLRDQIGRAADLLHARGATVVWLTAMPIGPNAETSGQPETELIGEPQRFARYNELLAEVAARRAPWMKVVDLAGWLAGTGEDARLRTDGVHFDDARSREVAERFLADAVLRAAGRLA